MSDSQACHRKLLRWIGEGVEESSLLTTAILLLLLISVINYILIDPIANPPTVRIYNYDVDTNSIVRQELVNPRTATSNVLNGFVMDMQNILC